MPKQGEISLGLWRLLGSDCDDGDEYLEQGQER